MEKTQAFTDVRTLRQQAREHTGDGAVTAGYAADRKVVLRLLNEALATEIVCVLRYRQELAHADLLAGRIVQLGGEPDFSPDSLVERSHAEYREGRSLPEMIEEDLVAERIAIDSYRDFIQYLGAKDPTTRRMLETILAAEEEHADELADLLQSRIPGEK